MARKTAADDRAELKDLREQVRDLEEENESLQEQLDQVAAIVGPSEDDHEDARRRMTWKARSATTRSDRSAVSEKSGARNRPA
jgi:hypothetical protein